MSDNASLKIWHTMQPMVRKEVSKGTESSVKSKKMVVTTAYNASTKTVGVTEAFGKEIQVPVAGMINPDRLLVGTSVWAIALHGSWSNAMVCMLGDGQIPPAVFAPVNLLDNPDFSIAQAGYGGNHGSIVYAADRWAISGIVAVTKSSDYIKLTPNAAYNGIYQRVEANRAKNGTYTIGLTHRGGSAYVRLYRRKSDGTNEQLVQKYGRASSEWLTTLISVDVDTSGDFNGLLYMIYPTTTDAVCVKEPFLYPGTYTADTLPPFVPRPYAVELAECQRYYENSWYGTVKTDLYQMIGSCWNGSHFDVPIEFKQQKRAKPSMTYYPSGSRTTIQGFIKSAYRDVTILAPEYRMGLRGVYARVNVAESDLTVGYSYQLHAHWEANADL